MLFERKIQTRSLDTLVSLVRQVHVFRCVRLDFMSPKYGVPGLQRTGAEFLSLFVLFILFITVFPVISTELESFLGGDLQG